MKKIILSAFILIISFNAIAQTTSCKERAETLLIKKIKPYQSNDLIPYYSKEKNKWGYFHRESGKIITKPILNEATFFHPNISLYYCFETAQGEDGCNAIIEGSKNGYNIQKIEQSEYGLFEAPYTETEKSYKNFVKENISGFEIDSKGNLSYFNPKFYDKKNDAPNILSVINFKEKYYAIVTFEENNKKLYTVINQNGEPIKTLENLTYYPTKKQSYSNEQYLWFLIQTGENKYQFKSLLKGDTLTEKFNDSPNWEQHAKTLGYAIFTVDNKKGILDLTTMKWKIAPSAKNDFHYLEYASLEDLSASVKKDALYTSIDIPTEKINENRKKAYIYIQNSNNEYYDLNLKLYKPSK